MRKWSGRTYGKNDGVKILAEELRQVTECLVQYNEQTDEHHVMTEQHTTTQLPHHLATLSSADAKDGL